MLCSVYGAEWGGGARVHRNEPVFGVDGTSMQPGDDELHVL